MIEKRLATVNTATDGERLDIAITILIPELSRKRSKALIDEGSVYINKKRILFAKHVVRKGDALEIFWEVKKQNSEINLSASSKLNSNSILFENENFLAVNKPAGVPTQATLTSSHGTILHEIEKLDPQKFKLASLHLVHRLDKDTSGILLVARNAAWRKILEDAFREHKVQKVYEALCFAVPKKSEGSIDFPIAKNQSQHNAYYPVLGAGRKHADQKSASTRYEVVEAFEKIKASHVRCFPKTGRTHQIRVHLMAIGCPILGDKTYSQNVVGHPLAQVAFRQMLHAKSVQFKGPKGELFQIEAPLPADFLECLENMSGLKS